MKCYVAGPMTGIPAFNFPAFDSLTAHLRSLGWEVVNPAERDRALYDTTAAGFAEGNVDVWSTSSGFDFHAAMRYDLGAITTCDAIVFLPGWQRSTGAGKERRVAEDCGLQLIFATVGDGGWLLNDTDPAEASTPSEVDMAWLAGIIEGEGTFGLHRTIKNRGGVRHQYRYPQIRVRMTDEDVIRKCDDICRTFGGGVYGPVQDEAHPHYKPFWQWTITGDPARSVLRRIIPYLGERRLNKAGELMAWHGEAVTL